MDERATGIILRVHPLTDTSLIVNWLTPEMGRVATVAKGARRLKSPFHGKLDLYYLAEFSFARSRRSELHTLREVTLLADHPALRREYGHLQQAAYCASLIESATETESPLPTLYALMLEVIERLPQRPPTPLMVFAFELQFLMTMGLMPELDSPALAAGSRAILERLSYGDWNLVMNLKLAAKQVEAINRFIENCLSNHLGRVPHRRAAAVNPAS